MVRLSPARKTVAFSNPSANRGEFLAVAQHTTHRARIV